MVWSRGQRSGVRYSYIYSLYTFLFNEKNFDLYDKNWPSIKKFKNLDFLKSISYREKSNKMCFTLFILMECWAYEIDGGRRTKTAKRFTPF